MDVFGKNLSDDFFEDNENYDKKSNNTQTQYNARICESKWFMKDNSNLNEDENCMKYKADYYYFQKQYDESSRYYKLCLNSDNTNNSLNQRDCLEGLVRSLIKLGNYMESLKYGDLLLKNSCNNDQITISKSLLALVAHSLGNFQDEISYLQHCIDYHPFNADLWLRIALCYSNLHKYKIPLICNDKLSECTFSTVTVCPMLHSFNLNCHCLNCPCHLKREKLLSNDKNSKVTQACFIRAKLLYQGSQTKSFSTSRKLIALDKITMVNSKINVSPELIELVQKKLIEDFKKAQNKESNCDTERLENEKSFEEKWMDFLP